MSTTITPQELAHRKESGEPLRLLDVRSPAEFSEVHVTFAQNMPLDSLNPGALQAEAANAPLYVICRSGSRGRQACERLQAAGLNARNVEGGTAAWEAAGLPVERSGRKVISLERQVRIAAGLLVLTGVLLGWMVHPALYGLSAFVGGGLVFAGITDWCGMGMLMAKMPWNQARCR